MLFEPYLRFHSFSSVRVTEWPPIWGISETTWPVKVKFYVEHPWVGGIESLIAKSGLLDEDGRHAHIR